MSYDPHTWNGPAFAREYLDPVQLRQAVLTYPPAVALPNGAYSYCFDCSTSLAPGERCTTSDSLARLHSAGGDDLLSVACCPLDLADELAARRHRRSAVYQPIPQPEPEPSRWRRWWRKAM